MKKLFDLFNPVCLHFVLFALVFCFISRQSDAQTRNLYVEGDGDQMAVIQALASGSGAAGSAGLELIRGDSNSLTDWRLINDNGDLRLQMGNDNFTTAGSNLFSIRENGNTGIGCSNPMAKLSICSGQIGFSNSFTESAADKISLDGYRFDQTDMVGIGYETSLIAGPGGIEEFSDLYYKTEGSHRWYTNTNADIGNSATMVLNRDGNLGVGIKSPARKLDVFDGARITDVTSTDLEFFSTTNNRVEAEIYNDTYRTKISSFWGDLLFAASTTGDLATDMVIQASSGYVGIGTTSPATSLHVLHGTDVEPTGGGYFQVGSSIAYNLGIDPNEIMARNNGVGSTLRVQYDEGDVLICGLESGQVGIGIANTANLPDDQYLLAVDGKIIAEEVRVELSGVWPDYVFKPEYKLLTIEELEASINKNGHLPGIPSADQVEEEGIEIGDMQKRMMEKIEVLSLYIIQQNKEIKELKRQVDKLSVKK